MNTVGLTGPTGAGKSTALQALSDLGAAVIDCDGLYHRLLEECQPMRDELAERFGAGVLAADNRETRFRLRGKVLGDQKALEDLNAITHRHVIGALTERLARARSAGRAVAVIEAIALLESGAGALCDWTVAVLAPEENRLARIMARDGLSEAQARARIQAQKSAGWYAERCDRALYNCGGDRQEFYQKSKSFFQELFS